VTPAIIISRYNDTDPTNRRRNVREGIALARWAAAQGYCPVGWWDDLDTIDPPCDSDPAVRQAALERSATRARMVGAAGGVAIVPGWYNATSGMEADFVEWRKGCVMNVRPVVVTRAEIEPYLPRDLVGQVQAAVNRMGMNVVCTPSFMADEQSSAVMRATLRIITEHTGITPTEVTP
jgi:hypothetical protein